VAFGASLADTLHAESRREGAPALERRYRALRERHGADYTYDFAEPVLNTLGYRLLREGHLDAAVAAFRLNAEEYPRSLNVHDSLGEALLAAGRTGEAAASLQRAIALGHNPHSYRLLQRIAGLRSRTMDPRR
jgi:tetratricopeptide (TPR) repeat protein